MGYAPRVHRALPYVVFGAVTLLAFQGFLLRGRTLYSANLVRAQLGETPRPAAPRFPALSRVSDNAALLRPQLASYNQGLESGRMRLWYPGLLGGYPASADPMVHPFYPPHLVLHAALPAEEAFEISMMLHLFFAGAAMYWLLGALGRSPAAALAGGLVWMLFGYHAAWFSTAVLEGASVFAPLALLAIVRGLERRRLLPAAAAGLAAGLMALGSHPQHALFFFAFLLAWLAAAAFRGRRGFVLAFAAIFAVATAGTALVEILPRLESLAAGDRRLGHDFARLYGNPLLLLAQALGVAFGKVALHSRVAVHTELAAFAGVAALGLAITAVARAFREPEVRFAAVAGLAVLLLALAPPLVRLYQLLPGLNVSPPCRLLAVLGLCVAILAARGWDAVAQDPGRVPKLMAAAAAGFVLLCAVGVGPMSFRNAPTRETALGMALAAGAALAAGRRALRPAAFLGFAALLLDLFPNFIRHNPHYDPAPFHRTPEAVRFAAGREKDPFRAAGALGAPAERAGESRRSEALTLGSNMLALYGIEALAGFEAVIPARYVRFAEAAGGRLVAAGRTLYFPRPDSPLLDAANLKYVFDPYHEPPGPRFQEVGAWGDLRLYENTTALPRAYFVSGVIPASDMNEAAKLLAAPDFDPHRSAVLESGGAVAARPAGPAAGIVKWIERSADRVLLEVESPEAALLVLSDNHYPGWEAALDGRPVPIHPANVAFRGVAVPAGRHAVEFRYRPASVRLGALGSSLAALLVLAALGAGVLRARRIPPRPADPGVDFPRAP